MGDYESMETIQFVPGWVDFTLNNGVRLDIMTSLKGVDLSFDECLAIAPVAEIEGVMAFSTYQPSYSKQKSGEPPQRPN